MAASQLTFQKTNINDVGIDDRGWKNRPYDTICRLQVEIERLHHAKKRGKDLLEAWAEEDRIVFMQMLSDCHKYAMAMNAKSQPFPFYYSHNIKE